MYEKIITKDDLREEIIQALENYRNALDKLEVYGDIGELTHNIIRGKYSEKQKELVLQNIKESRLSSLETIITAGILVNLVDLAERKLDVKSLPLLITEGKLISEIKLAEEERKISIANTMPLLLQLYHYK